MPIQYESCGTSTPHSVGVHNYTNIELHALIGVYEWERKDVRPLIFDVQLTTLVSFDVSREDMAAQLADWMQPCRYRLLEALAEHLAGCMLHHWPCLQVVISIEKPGAMGDLARVGVRIMRNT